MCLQRPLAISGTFVLFGFNVQVVASDMPGNIINVISNALLLKVLGTFWLFKYILMFASNPGNKGFM